MARKPVTTHQPWHPYEWEPADAYALQALAKGIANGAPVGATVMTPEVATVAGEVHQAASMPLVCQ